MPKTSVVILNFNGRDFLLRFLPPLIRHTPNAEIIVADNASTDDSIAILEQFPEIRKIILPKNYGYAGGYNEALKQLDSAYFLLLNSDIEVTAGWLDPLESFMEDYPVYAAVQPKILDYNRKSVFEYAGAAGGFIDRLGYPYCRGRIFDTLEEDKGQYDTVTDVFWCSGACFMIRSEAFRKAGGFDADFFAHMEEIDLCWRIKKHGYKLACIPQSVVYHVGGGTLAKSNPRKTYLNFRNGISLLIKNLSSRELVGTLLLRFILDLLAGVKFWKEDSFAHFRAVVIAWRDSLFSFKTTYKKRKAASGPANGLSKRQLVLWEYYIRNRKTYSDLNNTR